MVEKNNLEKAQLLLENKMFGEAQEILENEYLRKRTFKVNNMLSTCYMLQEKNQEAFETMQEYIEEYTKDNVKFEKYITVGIRAGKILKIQQYLADIAEYMTDYEANLFNKLVLEVQNEVKQTEEYQQVKKQLKYLGMLPKLEQYKFINQCYCLEKNVFYENVQIALVDNDVHPLVKGMIIFELEKLHETNLINVLSITGQKLEIRPNELDNPIEISNNLVKYLSESIDDPVKLKYTEQNICLKIMMIFYDDIMLKNQSELLEVLTPGFGINDPDKNDFSLGQMLENHLRSLEI